MGRGGCAEFQLSYEVLNSASWQRNQWASLPMQTGLLVHHSLTHHSHPWHDWIHDMIEDETHFCCKCMLPLFLFLLLYMRYFKKTDSFVPVQNPSVLYYGLNLEVVGAPLSSFNSSKLLKDVFIETAVGIWRKWIKPPFFLYSPPKATDSNMAGEDGFDEKGCNCEISVEDLLPSVKSVIRAVRWQETPHFILQISLTAGWTCSGD